MFIELVSNFIQIFIWTHFIVKSLGFKHSGYRTKIVYILISLLAFFELSFINYIVVFDGFLSGIVILTLIVYAIICLKGSLFQKLFVILFSMSIIYASTSVVLFFFSYMTKSDTQSLILIRGYLRLLMHIVCRIFEYFIFKFIIKVNMEYSLSIKEWILFTCMPFLTWVAINFMVDTSFEMKSIDSSMFYIALIMVAINVITFYFLYKIKQDTETKLEYELLKMQHDNVKQMETNMMALYENTYSVKHDLEKHLLAVKIMAENNSCDDINEYVESIIRQNFSNIQKLVFTDNDVLNAVINTKLEICKQKNIYTSINIANDAVKYIKTSDVVVVFGNIFDNAIEAAEKTSERIITLNVRLQGGYVSVYMENSFSREHSDVNLKTTKKEKTTHGFGLKNVKKTVEDSGGMIQHFQDGDMFCCDILMKKWYKMPNSTKTIPNSTKV